MTAPTPPTPTQSPRAHDGLDSFFDAIRAWGVRRRTSGDRWMGGVCSGVADRFSVDPVVVRAALVLLTLFGGAGLTVYLLCWALLPDSTGVSATEKALRHGDAGSVLLLVVTAIAVVSAVPWSLHHSGFWGAPWGLLVAGGFVWWAVRRGGVSSGHRGGTPTTAPYEASPPPAWPAPDLSSSATQTSGASSTATTATVPAGHAAPAVQAAPRTQRRRSGGILALLVAAGAALIGYGGALLAGRQLSFSGDHRVIAMAVALALVGLVVLALGITGRRAGLVGLLALALAALTLAAGSVHNLDRFGGRTGDAVWRPASVPPATPYQLLAGQGRLDLTGLSPAALGGGPATQPVSVGAGQLRIVVPQDVTVRVDAHVGVGQINRPLASAVAAAHRAQRHGPGSSDSADASDVYGGSDVSQTVTVGSGTPSLVVEAEVLVGQISIVTSDQEQR